MRFELAIGFDLQPGRALPAASVPAPIAQGVPKERQLATSQWLCQVDSKGLNPCYSTPPHSGCGFGTLPWSLPLSSNVHWFDVDLPAVLQEKQVHLLPPPGMSHGDCTPLGSAVLLCLHSVQGLAAGIHLHPSHLHRRCC